VEDVDTDLVIRASSGDRDQATDLLGIPVGTYKSRLHPAAAAMRAALEADARPPAVCARISEVAR
jgi:hypothetical protein